MPYKDIQTNFKAYMAESPRVNSPVLVLLQYICGVNQVMRNLADEIAQQGYTVVVPDMFWRIEPGIELIQDPSKPDPEQIKRSLELNAAFDDLNAQIDLKTVFNFCQALPNTNQKIGVLGYCLGGRLSYLMAAQGQVACAVSYYGVNLEKYLDLASKVACPMLVHIAEKDMLVPDEAKDAIRDRFSQLSQTTVITHPGVNHAFALPNGPNYVADVAKTANKQSMAFLNEHLR